MLITLGAYRLKYSATGAIHEEKQTQLNTMVFKVVALWSKIDILI